MAVLKEVIAKYKLRHTSPKPGKWKKDGKYQQRMSEK